MMNMMKGDRNSSQTSASRVQVFSVPLLSRTNGFLLQLVSACLVLYDGGFIAFPGSNMKVI